MDSSSTSAFCDESFVPGPSEPLFSGLLAENYGMLGTGGSTRDSFTKLVSLLIQKY